MRMLGLYYRASRAFTFVGVKTTSSMSLLCIDTSFAWILEFVGSLSRSEVVDEDGKPVLDSRGIRLQSLA